ncbi:MAG: MaoC/PaaZ C-terminal domain-containing protein [Pseudomonadota bacterium]
MTSRYFEDWTEGEVVETRGATITESQIIDFAMLYDPQPMHIDKQFADAGPFGGLIASGFQTLSVSFRLFYDLAYLTHSNIVGVGLDEVRWTAPVRAGDTLRCFVEVLALSESRSKSDRGSMTFKLTTRNQDGLDIMSFRSTCILKKRPDET